ncbi:hypothetical protein D0Z07_0045 [Hyphodiscus hymeniophilus]|uniref:Uncharacterized protein n=1 Tax=Hyphodiscus hymeniophilus TaxID=353542 RepID=A0A9P6VRU0_9HELO|nr:hypothetical protein D0Z07_0045 [Hyphodiscus hymeniophilus]
MRTDHGMTSSRLSRIICTSLLFTLASCGFERGDRYWSGKPQPIGIDFGASHVIAIYANDTGEFTTLAALGNLPGNEYGTYMYSIYAAQKDWGNDELQIIDYDDDESRDPSESWLELFSKAAKPLEQRFKSWACYDSWGVVRKAAKFLHFEPCYTEYGDWEYSPQRPKSRYQHLLTQARMNQLRNILPKWFRNSQPTGMTRSKLILYIVEYLERIKELSVKDHGIHITSAIVSRPSWANNEYDDIFDEACLLAGIEVLEQPHSRVDLATKVLSIDRGPVLVLDHGYYQLGIHRCTWDEHDSQYHERGSMGLDQFGTVSILRDLADRIIWGYNLNVTEEERGWPSTVPSFIIMNKVMNARLQIKYSSGWPDELEFENRTIGIDLMDSTGFLRVLNLTGEDVENVEQDYVEEISNAIRDTIVRHSELYAYAKSQNFSLDEYMNVADILANLTAPPEIGSWIEGIGDVIVLDSGTEASLLYQAAQLALGQNVSHPDDSKQCIPTIQSAARGAALRARDWIKYWEGYEEERLYYREHFDEDGSEIWEAEEDEYEEKEEGEVNDNDGYDLYLPRTFQPID